MSEITTIINEKLCMQLDSVSLNKHHNVIAIGAYMIDPLDPGKRIGKIFLIQLIFENSEIISHKILQDINISGVLDLRWEPIAGNILAVATSSSLELFQLDEEQQMLRKTENLELSAMALYTQWISMNTIVYSDSDGVVNIVTTNPLQKMKSKKVHDNLTWVVQYSSKHDVLFCGSDEGKFTGFLLEDLEDDEKHYTKKFNVGVTSILFFGENVLAVGSYDDTLKIFTIDSVNPIILTLKRKIEFGGAPWRTISFPCENSICATKTSEFYVIVACARNGIQIIHLNCDNWMYETVTTCMEFEGYLAYGLDAKLEQLDVSRKFTIFSCYFDNQQLHVWKTIINSK